MMMGKMASTVQVAPLGYSFGEVTVRLSSPKTYRTSFVNIFDQLYIAFGFSNGFRPFSYHFDYFNRSQWF